MPKILSSAEIENRYKDMLGGVIDITEDATYHIHNLVEKLKDIGILEEDQKRLLDIYDNLMWLYDEAQSEVKDYIDE